MPVPFDLDAQIRHGNLYRAEVFPGSAVAYGPTKDAEPSVPKFFLRRRFT